MIILALIQEAYNPAWWERLLDRYGWPTFIAIAGAFVTYKLGKAAIYALWPLAKRYVENLQKASEDANALMREQLHLANLRTERESKEIVTTLKEMSERANDIHIEQTRALKRILSHLDKSDQ